MIWNPAPYLWPDGKSAAACFSVDVDATSPYLWHYRDGLPNGIAAPEHRQYGMRQGLARLVAMLDRLGIKGSFFVPGVVAEENPDLLPGLVKRGHEIGLHGYYHEIVADTSDQRFTDALAASILYAKSLTISSKFFKFKKVSNFVLFLLFSILN